MLAHMEGLTRMVPRCCVIGVAAGWRRRLETQTGDTGGGIEKRESEGIS